MLSLPRFVDTHPCAYLPDRDARMEYVPVWALSGAEYEAQMQQRFRKFGYQLFRPICIGCSACRPLRVPVATFTPDRSQRRCLVRNTDLMVQVAPPIADDSRVSLYNRYHASQEMRKDWPVSTRTLAEYADFVESPLPTQEVSVWSADGMLLAVVLCDVTPTTLSAVYHFHDPAFADRGLGTFAILQTLRVAAEMGKFSLYLGYYVAGSRSMSYKARFRPCDILTDGQWQPLPPPD